MSVYIYIYIENIESIFAVVVAEAVVVGTFQRRRRRHIVRFVPFCVLVSWSMISVG